MKDRYDDPLHHERTLLQRDFKEIMKKQFTQWYKGKVVATPWRIDPTIHCTMSEHSYNKILKRSWRNSSLNGYKGKVVANLKEGKQRQSIIFRLTLWNPSMHVGLCWLSTSLQDKLQVSHMAEYRLDCSTNPTLWKVWWHIMSWFLVLFNKTW